jgi:hypothetical protein
MVNLCFGGPRLTKKELKKRPCASRWVAVVAKMNTPRVRASAHGMGENLDYANLEIRP